MREDDIRMLPAGSHFNFKGFEWIALDNNVDGGVLAVMTSSWNGEKYRFDEGCCGNYAKSSLRRKLLNELLPTLGEDNLIPHEVDLVADNGDDRYGKVFGPLEPTSACISTIMPGRKKRNGGKRSLCVP